ncbi:conserved hypothetical protein [Ricinus communis]|uniref:Uncharacterized protein n=1 Tax=Ricinus communis TaxID=3988 RepID=B9TAX1_RICCO|nr:conserved hypothetical protein [Ricinus communis]
MQAFLGQLAFRDVGQVGNQAGRTVLQVAQRRQRQAGPENLARFLPAPYFHHAAALLREGVLEVLVVVRVQEQDVAADGFHRRVAEQALGALVPAGDVAHAVHRQHGLVDLVEDLRLVRQLRFDLGIGVRRALGQRMHLHQRAGEAGQGFQLAQVVNAVRAACDFVAAEAHAVGAHFLQQRAFHHVRVQDTFRDEGAMWTREQRAGDPAQFGIQIVPPAVIGVQLALPPVRPVDARSLQRRGIGPARFGEPQPLSQLPFASQQCGFDVFGQVQVLHDLGHRHLEQAVQQREDAGHEGEVLLVAVAAVALAQVFQRGAAQCGRRQHQVRWAVRVLARVQEQLQPALQLAPAQAADGLAEARDLGADRERGRVHQFQQVIRQRRIRFQLRFQLARVGVARQQGQHRQHAPARRAVVAFGHAAFQRVVAAEPGKARVLTGAVRGQVVDVVGEVRSEQRRQRTRARQFAPRVARHGAQRDRCGDAFRQHPVEQHAIAGHLQFRQAARRAVGRQRVRAHGQHHAVGRQHVQDGGRENGHIVQQHDAVEGSNSGQQVRCAEQVLQRGIVESCPRRAKQQSDPLVLRVGDGAYFNHRERGAGH